MARSRQYDDGFAIYERQSWETDEEWHAYMAYRNLFSDRSYQSLCEVMGVAPNVKIVKRYQSWAKKNRWDERNLDHDRDRDRDLRKRESDALADMRVRQLKNAVKLQDLGGAQLARYASMLDAMCEVGEHGIREAAAMFKPRDIVQFIQIGAELERKAHDMPDSVIEERVASVDQLRQRQQDLLLHKEGRQAMRQLAKLALGNQ